MQQYAAFSIEMQKNKQDYAEKASVSHRASYRSSVRKTLFLGEEHTGTR